MADKVYPSGKPATTSTTIPATANGTFPATKSQLYGQTKPAYRIPAPTTKKSKHSRSCCCSCCLWTTVAILVLLLLIGVAGVIFYVLYRPHRPTFTISALKISTLNFTSTSQVLTTNINLNITTRNPNKKLTFIYNPMTISLLTTSDGVVLGTGSVPGFVHGTKNTTLLDVAVTSNGQALDDTSAGKLTADLKGKNGLSLTMELNTKVKVKLGGLKLPKVGIRVNCDGIKGSLPSGKVATTASVGNSKCNVDLRIKIWKWTF